MRGLDWMQAGLPAALAEKLEAHPGLRPLYGELILPEGAAPGPVDAQRAAAVGRREGARFVFSGRFRRPEWKLEITLRLWSVDAKSVALVGEKTVRGDFSDAFELLEEAANALTAKAGRAAPDEALPRLHRIATKDFYAFTLYGRGMTALHGMGAPPDLIKAEKDLSRAVFIDPKFAEAHRMLALVLARKGKEGSARGHLAYALDLRPDYYPPLMLSARAAYQARTRDEAIELCGRALALRPWDLDVRYWLGEMLWEGGDIDAAYRELRRLVDFRPDNLPARRVLVLIHASKGDGEELARELEAILELDRDDEAAKLDLGAAYHALGRDDEAIAIYEAVVAKSPKHMQALKFLGDLYKSRGDLSAAIAFYERALVANRNDPRPYFLLGAAYQEAGKPDEAIRIYKAAQKFPRYLPEAYSNLGALYYRRGNNLEAMFYLKIAAARRPQNPRIHYNYGLALAQAHVRDAALAEFTLASELDPGEPDFRFGLGVALLRLGRIEEAEKAFHEAVKLKPEHADARHNLQLIDELRRRAREGEIQIE